jgi:hypothetical protein
LPALYNSNSPQKDILTISSQSGGQIQPTTGLNQI